MAEFNDLPDQPGPTDPFSAPSPSVMLDNDYSGRGDDAEIRRIRRRVTPFGKAMISIVLVAVIATGYLLVRSARDEAATEEATTEGLAELQRITSQDLPHDQLAARIRDVYARFNVSPRIRMSARRFLAGL